MCGFLGMVAQTDIAAEIHLALQALQHRGQDSAGIATIADNGTRFCARRGLGSITNALSSEDIQALPGPIGIGHVRYPTIGSGLLEDTQPFFYRVPGVLMAHNGNLTNYTELKENLQQRSIHLMSHCDVEPALCEFAAALMAIRSSGHTIDDALEALKIVQQRIRGAYSLCAALHLDGKPTLIVLRDAHGVRPVVVGHRRDGGWVASSESVALDVLDVDGIFEPKPGEAVFLRHGEAPVRRELTSKKHTPCIFEFIYFARPDAIMSGQSVYEIRLKLGRQMAKRIQKKKIEADVVIPVPDTARPAATTLAEELGLKLREGFIKNRYSGRTFIMFDSAIRETALRLKLNTIPHEIRNRRVLLVDDSIVRGATLGRVIALVRSAGAREIHLA
ncbi:MAG TPA: amidophosphoribosyltransferase, partial [Myxococcales bacterium]|nr:amidophosphoribosyltransferase [Myxococcales bacterium]